MDELQMAIDRLAELCDRLNQIEARLGIARSVQPWVDKHAAAQIVNRNWKTLDRWRVVDESLVEGVHWQNDGGKIVYHSDRLAHWYSNRTNPAAHVAWLADQATQRSRKRLGRPPKNN